MNTEGVHVKFARDLMLFILQSTLNKLPFLLISMLFSIHYLKKKNRFESSNRTKKKHYTQFSYNQWNIVVDAAIVQ